MKRSLLFAVVAALPMSLAAELTVAEELVGVELGADAASDESWYDRTPPTRAPKPSLSHQKAALRGQQRMARLEAMRWYGYSNSRPTASGMPWTTMYSPAWQQPGGRPFAWYQSNRPVVIYYR